MFGVLIIAVPLFAFSSVIRNSNQQLEHRYWIFRGWVFLPTLDPTSCVKLPEDRVYSCLPLGYGWRWVAATVLRAETDRN